MEAEEVVEEELWREIWREMVPNWDMGMGPRPGPWGTVAEDVAAAGGGEGGRDISKHASLLVAGLLEMCRVVLI